jgi:hypothetical protein
MANRTEDLPHVDNYPLKEWLDKHGGRCNWSLPLGGAKNPSAYVESWILRPAGEVIVVVHAKGHGWNIYTAENSNGIAEALADAERRLGLLGAARG